MSKFITLANAGVQQLQPYQPGKPISELERELGISHSIKLASNENPLGPSEKVNDVINAALPELALYPDGNGFALKQALAAHLNVEMESITLGNGSEEILRMLVQAFVNQDNETLFSQYAFAVYAIATQMVGAKANIVPASQWGNDLTAMLAAITPKTRLIFIANPNNPTGTWVGEQALRAFLDHVPKDVFVALDEAYYEYAVNTSDYPDTLGWLKDYPNLIILRTFSKAYGLAGLRVGYGISHPEVADILNRVRPAFNTNQLAQAAATVALQDQDHIARAVATNEKGMQQLMGACDDLGLGYIPSKGNFLTVDMGQAAAPIYDAMLREGVILRPLANYGLPNHLRITVGLPDENARCIEALGTVCQ